MLKRVAAPLLIGLFSAVAHAADQAKPFAYYHDRDELTLFFRQPCRDPGSDGNVWSKAEARLGDGKAVQACWTEYRDPATSKVMVKACVGGSIGGAAWKMGPNDQSCVIWDSHEVFRELPDPEHALEAPQAPMSPSAEPARPAGGKRVPFAYTMGPNGTVVFYKQACRVPTAGSSKKWQEGGIIYRAGALHSSDPGCWSKYYDASLKAETVEFCVSRQDANGSWQLGQCMFGDPKAVYKGNPFPESAF